MKTFESKIVTIDVIGTWDGGEGEVTAHLTRQGYVWKIQSETHDRVKLRLKHVAEGDEFEDPSTDPRVRLVILGDGLYQQWSLEKGDVLALGDDGELVTYNSSYIDEHFTQKSSV